MNIYIGNLDYGVTESDLSNAFAEFGTVSRANVIIDHSPAAPRASGSSKCPTTQRPTKPSRT